MGYLLWFIFLTFLDVLFWIFAGAVLRTWPGLLAGLAAGIALWLCDLPVWPWPIVTCLIVWTVVGTAWACKRPAPPRKTWRRKSW